MSEKEENKVEAKVEEAKLEAVKAPAAEAPKEAPKMDGTPKAPSKPKEAATAEKKSFGAGANANSRDANKKGGGAAPGRGGPRGAGGGRGGPRTDRSAAAEAPSEFTEKVVQVRRVTKVVKGGKKLSFRAVVVIGNEKGKVGVGVGKASEVINAIKKAVTDAKKSMIDVPMIKTTITHIVTGVAGGSKVMLRPAADGTGIIAGGTARIVLELGGLGDVIGKSQGSKSPLNVARATVEALKSTRSFKDVAAMRGLTVKKMLFA